MAAPCKRRSRWRTARTYCVVELIGSVFGSRVLRRRHPTRNWTGIPNSKEEGETAGQSFSLADLSPDKGWQTLTQEVPLEEDDIGFAVQVKGGFDGLLIDYFKIEQISRVPDSKQLKDLKLSGWPVDQALVAHDGVKIWDGEGLYYEHFHLEDALRKMTGVHLDESPFWVWREKRGFNGTVLEHPRRSGGLRPGDHQ